MLSTLARLMLILQSNERSKLFDTVNAKLPGCCMMLSALALPDDHASIEIFVECLAGDVSSDAV